jgi:hypothetical protein
MFDHIRFSRGRAHSLATVSELTHAWSCATSFGMCQAGYAPNLVPVGTRLALVNVHALQLLVLTGADPRRLSALADRCRQRAGAARRWRSRWMVALRRRGSLSSPWSSTRWAYVFSALTRASRDDIAARWTIAAELAEAALRLVRVGGAQNCMSARARLVAEAGRALARVDWSQFGGCAGLGGDDPLGRSQRGGGFHAGL